MTPSTIAFIAEQRDLLDALERFCATPDYQRLLTAVAPLAAGDLETWLAQWLISRSIALAERPIDLIAMPGGLEVVEQLLMRIGAGVYS